MRWNQLAGRPLRHLYLPMKRYCLSHQHQLWWYSRKTTPWPAWHTQNTWMTQLFGYVRRQVQNKWLWEVWHQGMVTGLALAPPKVQAALPQIEMSPTSGPLRDVLLVGFGAVGAICKYFSNARSISDTWHHVDSLILKRSGLARVTSVARSNYDIVNSACSADGIHCQILPVWSKGEGVHFRSAKYGEIKGWKPDRCEFFWTCS